MNPFSWASPPRWTAHAWAAPATALGGLLGLLAHRARWQTHNGIWEVHGPDAPSGVVWTLFERSGVEALTLGHVVLARNAELLHRWRAHERVHVRQYERWGALLLLAYPTSSLWQRACGRCAYRMNRFERAAFAASDPAREACVQGQVASSDSMP